MLVLSTIYNRNRNRNRNRNKSIDEEWITIIGWKLESRKFTELNGNRNGCNERALFECRIICLNKEVKFSKD